MGGVPASSTRCSEELRASAAQLASSEAACWWYTHASGQPRCVDGFPPRESQALRAEGAAPEKIIKVVLES